MKSLLFVLPAEPVDRYELSYYRLDPYGDGKVSRVNIVYHVNASWAEVCPEEADRHGAAFEDDWQVIVDGLFQARMDGWKAAEKAITATGVFGTFEKAKEAAIRRAEATVQAKREELKEMEQRLEEIRDERASNMNTALKGSIIFGVVFGVGTGSLVAAKSDSTMSHAVWVAVAAGCFGGLGLRTLAAMGESDANARSDEERRQKKS